MKWGNERASENGRVCGAREAQVMTDTVTVDSLVLANHVEVVNGLLYVSGGGWTDHRRPLPPGGAPLPSHLGIGVCVFVPWNETNRPHVLTVLIEDEDGNPLVKIEGHINVGRPPQLPQGAAQPVMLGFPLDVPFPHAGGYRVVASIDGDEAAKRWPFRVHDVPVAGAATGGGPTGGTPM
jgi:hypothetical protein